VRGTSLLFAEGIGLGKLIQRNMLQVGREKEAGPRRTSSEKE